MKSNCINSDLPAITEDANAQIITQGNLKVAPPQRDQYATAERMPQTTGIEKVAERKYGRTRRPTAEEQKRGRSVLQRQQPAQPPAPSVLGGSTMRPLFSPIAPAQRCETTLPQGYAHTIQPDHRGVFRQNQGKITPQQQIQIIGGNYQLMNQNIHNLQSGMRNGATRNWQRGPFERNALTTLQDNAGLEVQAKGFKNALSFNQRSSSIHQPKAKPETAHKVKPLKLEQLHEPVAMLQLQAITAETARQTRQRQKRRNAVTPLRSLHKNAIDQRFIFPQPNRAKNQGNTLHIDLQMSDGMEKNPTTQNTARNTQRTTARGSINSVTSSIQGWNTNQTPNKRSPRESCNQQQQIGQTSLQNWQKMKILNQEKFKQFQLINEQQLVNQILMAKNGKDGQQGSLSYMQQYEPQQDGPPVNSGDLRQFQQQYQEYLRMMQSSNHSFHRNQSWNQTAQQDPAAPLNEDKVTSTLEQNKNAFVSIIQGLQLQSLNVQNVQNLQEAVKSLTEQQLQPFQSRNKFQDKLNQEQARKALTAFVLSESQRLSKLNSNGEGQLPRGHRHRLKHRQSQHEEAPEELDASEQSANNSPPGRGDLNPSQVNKNLQTNLMTTGEASIDGNDFQNIVRTRTLSMISESKKYATEGSPDQAQSRLQDSKLTKKDKSETRSGGAHNWPHSGDGTLSAGPPFMQLKSGQQSSDSKVKQQASKSKQVLETKPMNLDQTLPNMSSRTRGVENSRSNDEMSQDAHSKSLKMHYQISIGKNKEVENIQASIEKIEVYPNQQKNREHLQTLLFKKQSTRKIKDERVKEYKVGKSTKIESGETKIICHENQHETSGTVQTYKAIQQSQKQDSRNEISIDNIAQGIVSQDSIKNEKEASTVPGQTRRTADLNLKFSPHSSKSNKKNLKLVLNFSNDNGVQNRGETALLTDVENTGDSEGKRIDGVKEPRFPQIEIQSKKSNMSTQGEGVIKIDGINRGGTNSLHEIADGLSLSAGETQTNLQPQYYLKSQNNGQNLVDPHSKFKALNGYVQNPATGNERRKITMGSRTIEIPNHNYQLSIQDPQALPVTLTESHKNSSNQNSLTQQMDAPTFSVDLVHQQLYSYFDRDKINRILQMNTNQDNNQFQLALSKFDRSNKKRPFKSKPKNKDLRFENGQSTQFRQKLGVLPTSLQQRSFVAPLGSLPEDQRYMKAIKNISQALNNANASRIKIKNKEVLENVKRVIPYLDTSMLDKRSQKARTPFILERDLKNQNGINYNQSSESPNRRQYQDFSQQVSHVPPATAGPTNARTSQKRIQIKEKAAKPDVPSLNSPLAELAQTTRTVTANMDTSQKNSYNTNRSSLKSNFRSTQDQQQQYQENLLNLFLKENKDFTLDKMVPPWPSDSTPNPNIIQGILSPDWKECLFNQDLIKKGVPVDRILDPNELNKFLLDSKAFILRTKEEISHRSQVYQQQIFTNEAITNISKDESVGPGAYGPSLTSRSFEKKKKYPERQTYSDNISIVDHTGKAEKFQKVPGEQLIQTPIAVKGCKTGRSQASQISGSKQGATQARASKQQKDEETTLMEQSLVVTQPSYLSSNVSPRSRAAEYEFRLVNCRHDDKLAKEEEQIEKIKPDVAKISLTKRQAVDVEKKQCCDLIGNMEMFEQQESLQENNESLVNLKIIQNQSAKLDEPSNEWPKTKLKSRLVHEPQGKGAFVLDNILDVRISDKERRSAKKEPVKKKSSQKSGRESDFNARKVTIRHKSPSQGEPISNQSQINNTEAGMAAGKLQSSQVSSQERERIIVGGNLEHASRNTASMDKERKSESIRRAIHDSNNLSFDAHGNALERNPGNKSEISKSSQGTRNHDCLGIRVGTQDSIYDKSIQDTHLTSREQNANTENAQKRIIVANNLYNNQEMLSKHGPGKIIGIRGNPNKQWMTKTTKDGRKFTQSLVRPLLLRELALKQTFQDFSRITEMEMMGLGVLELHRMKQISKPLGALTERSPRRDHQVKDISRSILKGLVKGTTRSRCGSRQSLIQDRQSPKQGTMLLSPRFGPNSFNDQQVRVINRPLTKFDTMGDPRKHKGTLDKTQQTVQDSIEKTASQLRQQLNTQGHTRTGKNQSEITYGPNTKDQQTLVVQSAGKVAQAVISQIQIKEISGKESPQNDGQIRGDENVSQWQGEIPDELPANPIADLVATKRSEKSKEAENQSKSSKSNRQQIHLKRGLKIDSKMGSGNATNSEAAKDQDNINTDRGEQMEGNIDQILANEPLHSQRETPTHELNYEAEAKSSRRHQEIQTQLREIPATTEIVISLDEAIQQIAGEEYIQRHEQDGTIEKLVDEAKKLHTDKNFNTRSYTYQANVDIDNILLQTNKGRETQGEDKEESLDSKETDANAQKRAAKRPNAEGPRDLVKIVSGHGSRAVCSPKQRREPQILRVSRIGQGMIVKPQLEIIPDSPTLRIPPQKGSFKSKTHNATRTVSRDIYSYHISSHIDQIPSRCLNSPTNRVATIPNNSFEHPFPSAYNKS